MCIRDRSRNFHLLVRRILKKDETLGLPDEQEKGVFEIMPTGLPDWKKMAEVIYTACLLYTSFKG